MTYPFREMSERALERFLGESRHAVLATTRADGSPQQSPVWYLFEGGQIFVSALEDTAKVRNMRRDPRVSVCIDGGHPDARAVTLDGSAVLRNVSGDTGEAMLRRIAQRYLPTRNDVDHHMARMQSAGESRLVVITPTRVTARDYNG